jgi:hypothetical protein
MGFNGQSPKRKSKEGNIDSNVGSANKNARVKEIMLAIFLDFSFDVCFSFF